MAVMNILTGTISGKLGAIKGDIQRAGSIALEVIGQSWKENFERAETAYEAARVEDVRKLGILNAAKLSLKQADLAMFKYDNDKRHFDEFYSKRSPHATGYSGDYKKSAWEAAVPKKNTGSKAVVMSAQYSTGSKTVRARIRYPRVYNSRGNAYFVGDENGNILSANYTENGDIDIDLPVSAGSNNRLYLITYQRHMVNGVNKLIGYEATPILTTQ